MSEGTSSAKVQFPAGKVKIGKSIAVTCEDCEEVIHWEWFLTPEEAKERRMQHIADHRSGKIAPRLSPLGMKQKEPRVSPRAPSPTAVGTGADHCSQFQHTRNVP